MFEKTELQIIAIEKEIDLLESEPVNELKTLRKTQLVRNRDELLEVAKKLSAQDKVYLARHPKRPNITEYIEAIFDDFMELKGDRQCCEDSAVLGGIASFHGLAVTVIGHCKGANLEENLKCNFGMAGPEGYRKALRLMKQAEKFSRPVITFIDTPGAYPGIEAEARGQGEAIARNLAEMSMLKTPIISIVTGEGSSGGALALGVADSVFMLENAVYSILSPEGFATILWKDSSRSGEACELMKLTAQDLKQYGIIERIISEPLGGAHRGTKELFQEIDSALREELTDLKKLSADDLCAKRQKKFRNIGDADALLQ